MCTIHRVLESLVYWSFCIIARKKTSKSSAWFRSTAADNFRKVQGIAIVKKSWTNRDNGDVETLLGESFSGTGAKSVAERKRQVRRVTWPGAAPISALVTKPALRVELQRSRKVLLHATHRRHVGKYEHLTDTDRSQC